MTIQSSRAEETQSAGDWLAQLRELERRGEYLRAYDIARIGLEQYPNDKQLQYRSVLVLARSGATNLARQHYENYQLADSDSEDYVALGARLSKDAALNETGASRIAKARVAATEYESLFKTTGGYFPGINAATLYLLADDKRHAFALARQIIKTLDQLGSGGDDEQYYRLASRAEALLILGNGNEAHTVLAQAFLLLEGDWAALATTRRQLRLVCSLTGQEAALLDTFLPPAVIHYCGHIIAPDGGGGRFIREEEAQVSKSIQRHLSSCSGSIGYGSLAAGADILIAEALLDSGGELHVALPFCLEEFIEVSVRPSGEEWVERFHRCLARAQSVRYATDDGYLGDDQLFTYCSHLAMGLAVLRSQYLEGPVSQLSIWDGEPATARVGTAHDRACWQELGFSQSTIAVKGGPGPRVQIDLLPQNFVRVPRAMLFGDVKGFSKLCDKQLPHFIEQVLGQLATVVEDFSDKICFRNTWGDGLFVVFEGVEDAAYCAMEMQRVMSELNYSDYELPSDLGLRLGCHFGPIYKTQDPILKIDNYFGAHVSRTARIEPVTPEGSVYVTEPFAAILALKQNREFACDYVGNIPAAKGYGDLSMYLLHRPA